jgi:hypothetical protein
MNWKIAEAKERFSEVVRAAGEAPQRIYNRDRLVAVVVEPEEFREFDAWRGGRSKPTLAETFAELRKICLEEDFEFEIPPRIDRPNPFLDDDQDESALRHQHSE